MKYYILCRTNSNFGIVVGPSLFSYLAMVDTFEKAESFIEDYNTYNDHDFMIIKGSELEWEEQYEEVIYTKQVLKSKKLKEEDGQD